jgi:hypothetical protein
MIGLERHTVKRACHSDTWIADGTARCERLRDACGGVACEIQHVGSTSVSGLAARFIRSGIVPISHTQDTAGPMARTAEDAANLLGGKRIAHLNTAPVTDGHPDSWQQINVYEYIAVQNIKKTEFVL